MCSVWHIFVAISGRNIILEDSSYCVMEVMLVSVEAGILFDVCCVLTVHNILYKGKTVFVASRQNLDNAVCSLLHIFVAISGRNIILEDSSYCVMEVMLVSVEADGIKAHYLWSRHLNACPSGT